MSYSSTQRPEVHKRHYSYWPRLPGAALAFNIARFSETVDTLVVVASSAREYQLLADELEFFLEGSGRKITSFPGWECLPYDRFSPHPEIVSERIRALSELGTGPTLLIICPEQILFRLAEVSFIRSSAFALAPGDTINVDRFRTKLVDGGYLSVSKVISPGEFAVRGGIIDVFPSGSEQPFRLDLFGSEIEQIRFFDPESQSSTGRSDSLTILPAKEFPLDRAAIDFFRTNYRRIFSGDPQASLIYRDVSAGRLPAGIEFYLPLFFDQAGSLFDYLPKDSHWIVPDDLEDLLMREWAGLQDRFEQCSVDKDHPPLPPKELALAPSEALGLLKNFPVTKTGSSKKADGQVATASEPPSYPVNHQASEPFTALVQRLKQPKRPRILLSAETPGRAQTLIDLLKSYQIDITEFSSWREFRRYPEDTDALIISKLDRGLILDNNALEIVVESQLYGERTQQRRKRARSIDPDAIIRSIAELQHGDPIVHADHGVGRFAGLESLEIDGQKNEFLKINYAGGGKLFVPVFNIGVLSRYIGGGGDAAPLHPLGGEQWVKARLRARQRAHDVAAELLKTQALRALRQGASFPAPEKELAVFCGEFRYEETPDQEAAINAVISDLQSARPMDRLVCGDVGFGKTEVALRAAFIVAHNGRQVALLAPTTLLAQQHLDTFSNRFARQPVRIEMLTRFHSEGEIKKILADIESGQVDIVIGTHRLLQRDVKFKRLGLVIVDEEHRFGVRQKERLKQMRAEVDLLTLTATPIPRTLNIALSGIKSISLITTPPAGRVSIKTSVQPFSKALIREACIREMHRGGQVYFLHNDVASIERWADQLRKLLPEASIRVAHGQMPRGQLEPVMRDFYHQRFDVLVCSTIIESGIDVPTANTIIINRADRFGLAQLHQLRGRVGRSKHQAFAFLLIPERESLSDSAMRRLNAVEELTELGVGFALANHDLEIRGAGELLGEDQSGAIEEVGFSLYSEYLSRAIRDLAEASDAPTEDLLVPVPADIELGVPAFIPDAFLPDVHSRLVIYQRVSRLTDHQELYELKLELMDRFGPLPDEALNLLDQVSLRLYASRLGITEIKMSRSGGQWVFKEDASIDTNGLSMLLTQHRRDFQMVSPLKLRVSLGSTEPRQRLALCDWLLQVIDSDREPPERSLDQVISPR